MRNQINICVKFFFKQGMSVVPFFARLQASCVVDQFLVILRACYAEFE